MSDARLAVAAAPQLLVVMEAWNKLLSECLLAFRICALSLSPATLANFYVADPVTATLADSGSTYRCVVSNVVGNTSSNPALLVVQSAPIPPSITSQPSNVTVTAGQTATFSITATGTAPLSYQWQKNGISVAGATSTSYTIFQTDTSQSGSIFTCVVSNAGGSVTSRPATLTVTAPTIALGQPLYGGTIYWLDPTNPGHGLVAANFDQSRWVMTTNNCPKGFNLCSLRSGISTPG